MGKKREYNEHSVGELKRRKENGVEATFKEKIAGIFQLQTSTRRSLVNRKEDHRKPAATDAAQGSEENQRQ